jgi:hypothetical protein
MSDPFFERTFEGEAEKAKIILPTELDAHQFKDRKSLYEDASAPRMGAGHGGYIAYDGVVHAETRRCCHCTAHYVYRKGSGAVRHFCPSCQESTCGRPMCAPSMCEKGSLYWERQFARIEAAERKRSIVDSYLKA